MKISTEDGLELSFILYYQYVAIISNRKREKQDLLARSERDILLEGTVECK